jgi:hypothetical protein
MTQMLTVQLFLTMMNDGTCDKRVFLTYEVKFLMPGMRHIGTLAAYYQRDLRGVEGGHQLIGAYEAINDSLPRWPVKCENRAAKENKRG